MNADEIATFVLGSKGKKESREDHLESALLAVWASRQRLAKARGLTFDLEPYKHSQDRAVARAARYAGLVEKDLKSIEAIIGRGKFDKDPDLVRAFVAEERRLLVGARERLDQALKLVTEIVQRLRSVQSTARQRSWRTRKLLRSLRITHDRSETEPKVYIQTPDGLAPLKDENDRSQA